MSSEGTSIRIVATPGMPPVWLTVVITVRPVFREPSDAISVYVRYLHGWLVHGVDRGIRQNLLLIRKVVLEMKHAKTNQIVRA